MKKPSSWNSLDEEQKDAFHLAGSMALIALMLGVAGIMCDYRPAAPHPGAQAGHVPHVEDLPDAPSCELGDYVEAAPIAIPRLYEHDTLAVAVAVSNAIHDGPLGHDIVEAVIHVESRGRTDAVSVAGARGLMQLLPTTAEALAAKMGWEYYAGIEFNPYWNVRLGAEYLHQQFLRFRSWPAALTAYHRGPANTSYILRNNGGEIPAHVKAVYSDLVLGRLGE